MTPKTTRGTVKCPKCGSPEVWPVLWGYPGDVYDRVVLGGCMIPPDAADSSCQSCGHQYDVQGGWDSSVWQAVELDEDLEIPEWLK